MSDYTKWPALKKLVARHEKRKEKFMDEAAELFHPHAVQLCRVIKEGIPEFTGCQLAMRHLYLEPRDLMVEVGDVIGEERIKVRLANIIDGGYLSDDDHKCWNVTLPERVQKAMRELDDMANYIDDNYSMVSGLYVDLTAKKPLKRWMS